MNQATTKIRLTYSKLGKVRFLGHRDVARLWERTLRKADIPVAMSSGFTPRARISFGLALPTGAESVIEMLDASVVSPVSTDHDVLTPLGEWRKRIDEALPAGFSLTSLTAVAEGAASLQESVVASSWLLFVDHPQVADSVLRMQASEEILLQRERKGETTTDDIRPGILSIEIAGSDLLEQVNEIVPGGLGEFGATVAVAATLATSGRGIRATELVQAMLPGTRPWDHLTRVIRTQQWIDNNGQRVAALSASVAPHMVCA